MALPKSLTQVFRQNMLLVGGGFRAYFAPYNATLGHSQTSSVLGPSILDLQVQGPFDENNPPAGFFDLGWIDNLKITPASKVGLVRSGYRGAVRAIYRGEVGESFDFQFKEMSRLSLKISSGTEVFNLLRNPSALASSSGPLSSSGSPAVPMGASGYNPSYQGLPTVFVPAGSGNAFPVGSYIVVDDDYVPGTYGQVGAAGIPVFQNAVTDIDFIRKTSDFVATVVQIKPTLIAGQDGLILNKPFVGGGNGPGTVAPTGPNPGTGKVQQIKGYAAREGGTFVVEWSALFLMTTIEGSQIAFYYPHTAISAFKGLANWAIEDIGTSSETGFALDTTMMALAFDDPIDGETVVRYCAYYPTSGKDAQI
jgi:hypothetical protein